MRVFLAAVTCQAHSSLSQPTNPQTDPQRATNAPKGPPRFPRGPKPLAGTRLALNPFLAYNRPYRPWSNAIEHNVPFPIK